jgi:hypothetical protein
MFFNLSKQLKIIIGILLIAPLRYFLFQKEYIYYFINRNKTIDYITYEVHHLAKYINITDIIILVFSLSYIFIQ